MGGSIPFRHRWVIFKPALTPRQVQRWRDGTAPCGDALFSLFKLAARVPGGVQLLLGEDVCPPATAAPTLKDRLDAATGRRGGKPQTDHAA